MRIQNDNANWKSFPIDQKVIVFVSESLYKLVGKSYLKKFKIGMYIVKIKPYYHNDIKIIVIIISMN